MLYDVMNDEGSVVAAVFSCLLFTADSMLCWDNAGRKLPSADDMSPVLVVSSVKLWP